MSQALSRRLLIAFVACLPVAALAWWNDAWNQRTRFTLDTSAQGAPVAEAVSDAVLPLRLHSGNFDFVAAREDGADLRVLAADDKTPLPFRVERFDAVNELALLWVRVPSVLPGSDRNLIHVYAGNRTAAAEPPAALHEAATLLAVSFDDADNRGADQRGTLRAEGTVTPEPNALLAGGARLAGTPLRWSAPSLRVDAGGAATLSLWARADELARATLLAWGPLALTVQDGRLAARVGGAQLAGGELRAAAWTHVALVLGGGRARLYVNGAETAAADATTPALEGVLVVGDGLRGAVDELQVASVARTAAWVALAAAAQGSEGRLVRSLREARDQADANGGHGGYIGILVKSLTIDAWVVIVILGGMFALALWVMAVKFSFIERADRDNRAFLGRFRAARDDLLHLGAGAAHPNSSLFRLYQSGIGELKKRGIGEGNASPLSGASLDAVKASVDADLVRESHRLNAQMVWLTIAISGGPFLGLLGTVVGVMITFAAIAAAGDVNVNAIAPGIAAALLATVAGLAVAIPALFGYNYLATRIKNISADMQIFVDEFITRVAEQYGAR
jgi:biopolymer transport protein ExbB